MLLLLELFLSVYGTECWRVQRVGIFTVNGILTE